MFVIRALRKEPILKEVQLKPTVIDKTNYQPFDAPVEQHECPTWDEVPKYSAARK